MTVAAVHHLKGGDLNDCHSKSLRAIEGSLIVIVRGGRGSRESASYDLNSTFRNNQ
jgi:hypothetical protein